MPTKSQAHSLSPALSISPQDINGGVNGAAVDLLGYEAALVVLSLGTVAAAAVHDVSLEHRDDPADAWVAVPAADLVGAFEQIVDASDDSVQSVGYRGTQRYIRAVAAQDTAGSAFAAVTVIRGHPVDSVTPTGA